MDILQIVQFTQAFFPYGFIKLTIVIIMGMYVIFASIIVRQENLIANMVEIPFSPFLRIVVIGHLLAAIAAFVMTLILL